MAPYLCRKIIPKIHTRVVELTLMLRPYASVLSASVSRSNSPTTFVSTSRTSVTFRRVAMATCHANDTFLTQDSASKLTRMLSLVTTPAKSASSLILWVVLSWRRDDSEAICMGKTVNRLFYRDQNVVMSLSGDKFYLGKYTE